MSAETIKRDGFTLELHQDTDVESPKDSMDMLGTLVTWHRRYCFEEDGQKRFGGGDDFLREAKEQRWIYLPVSMIDHSGISIWVGAGAHAMDPGGWDSGQVGFMYTTPERIEKAGVPLDGVRSCLEGEVQVWDQYLTGDVYGYVLKGPDGETVDSCWGIYGFKYAKEDGEGALEHAIKGAQAAEAMERSSFAL